VKKSDTRSVFGNNLVRYRKARNLTQEELAKLSGINRAMIAYYETSPVDPSASSLLAIAQALNLSMEELLSVKKPSPEDAQSPVFDARTFRRLAPVATLSPQQRLYVYKLIDSLVKEKTEATFNAQPSSVSAEDPEA